MCFAFTLCAGRASRKIFSDHGLASVISTAEIYVDQLKKRIEPGNICFALHSAKALSNHVATLCFCIPTMLADHLPLSFSFQRPPTLQAHFPQKLKCALVSVKGNAWRLVSFELSYVNVCSHICLAVLDISTRKWNESVTNVLASVELFSDQQLANSSSVFGFPETPWDGDSLSFRMEGVHFLSLIERREKAEKNVAQSCIGIRIRRIEIKIFLRRCIEVHLYLICENRDMVLV